MRKLVSFSGRNLPHFSLQVKIHQLWKFVTVGHSDDSSQTKACSLTGLFRISPRTLDWVANTFTKWDSDSSLHPIISFFHVPESGEMTLLFPAEAPGSLHSTYYCPPYFTNVNNFQKFNLSTGFIAKLNAEANSTAYSVQPCTNGFLLSVSLDPCQTLHNPVFERKEFPNVPSLSLSKSLIYICSRRKVKKAAGFFCLFVLNLWYSFIIRRKSFWLFLGSKTAQMVWSVSKHNPFKLHRKLQEAPKHQNRKTSHEALFCLLQTNLHLKVRIEHSKRNLEVFRSINQGVIHQTLFKISFQKCGRETTLRNKVHSHISLNKSSENSAGLRTNYAFFIFKRSRVKWG